MATAIEERYGEVEMADHGGTGRSGPVPVARGPISHGPLRSRVPGRDVVSLLEAFAVRQIEAM